MTSPKDEDDRYKLITSMELKKALINDVEIAGLEHAFSIVRVEKSSKLTLAAQDEVRRWSTTLFERTLGPHAWLQRILMWVLKFGLAHETGSDGDAETDCSARCI